MDGDLILYAGLYAIAFIVIGIAMGWRVQRARVQDAQRHAEEARMVAEQKMSDSVNGRTLAHAIRALDAKSGDRPEGIDRDLPRPNPILVDMADRFFPMPNDHEV